VIRLATQCAVDPCAQAFGPSLGHSRTTHLQQVCLDRRRQSLPHRHTEMLLAAHDHGSHPHCGVIGPGVIGPGLRRPRAATRRNRSTSASADIRVRGQPCVRSVALRRPAPNDPGDALTGLRRRRSTYWLRSKR
jgi:hypothetical protein